MASKAIIGSQSGHGSHHGSQHGSEVLENDIFGIENSASDSEIMGLIRTFASSYTDSSSLQILITESQAQLMRSISYMM